MVQCSFGSVQEYPIVMFIVGGAWGRGLRGEPMIAYLVLGT